MTTNPVFFDPTGKRKRNLGRLSWLIAAALLAAVALFAATVIFVPTPKSIELESRRDTTQVNGVAGEVRHAAREVKRSAKAVLRGVGWVPSKPAKANPGHPVSVGFYTPWDDASPSSLKHHLQDLDWVVPHWLSVIGPNHDLKLVPDPKGRAILHGAPHRPLVLPMIQNAVNGDWDAAGAAKLFADPRARAALIEKLGRFVQAERGGGIMLDFESLPPAAVPNYLRFVREINAAFDKLGLLVAVSAPFNDETWNYKAFGKAADRLFLMAYDEHWETGTPGPIASQRWFVDILGKRMAELDPAKTIVCIGQYAYDWSTGEPQTWTVEEAWLRAHDTNQTIRFDAASGNPTFDYTGEDGSQHHVWMLDAATAFNQMAAIRHYGAAGTALWRVGSEDTALWSVFGRHATGAQGLTHLPAGQNVDIEGRGELVQVDATPASGERTLKFGQDGLIFDETYVRLPSPYVIMRAGYHRGLVALTFDDGPDPVWTPQILDILKAEKVPATFFVIGQNALDNYGLLRRIVEEGNVVGNHSYTHPNLGLMSARGVRLELNSTQRLVQAFTGRTMRLFRAPFFGDAEPDSPDEIDAVLDAQNLGYLSVGLHVDSEDWTRPGVPAIIRNVVSSLENPDPDKSGQVVLLHDAGGNRAQTVAALTPLIRLLKSKGYRFVTVPQLIGMTPAEVMPPVSDKRSAQADKIAFLSLAFVRRILIILFGTAIGLGIARAAIMTALAILGRKRERERAVPPIDPSRFVSVLIPAFNEAKVIESSVRRVLASEDVRLEIIVIDDGSTDGTSNVVEAAFGDRAEVRLLTLENGGKAAALNRALALVTGDYVVALDADTQFEPKTIARLVRWFDDPEVGAVAGNARVGNRHNLVTRWQALEYITAQNLERRALGAVGAITVVPGAVGAWRATALKQQGGFPADTLAEDQDLTIAIQRAGWRVLYDQKAIAWTEAPDTVRGLARQRYRWAYGTLQCLWKHGGLVKDRELAPTARGLARVGLPQAWAFQIGFGIISPLIDLALIASIVFTAIDISQHGWGVSHDNVVKMAIYWMIFLAIDLAAAATAFALEPDEDRHLLWYLIPQRIGYRQIMYYVVLKAVRSAMRGPWVGWGKQERRGSVAGVG